MKKERSISTCSCCMVFGRPLAASAGFGVRSSSGDQKQPKKWLNGRARDYFERLPCRAQQKGRDVIPEPDDFGSAVAPIPPVFLLPVATAAALPFAASRERTAPGQPFGARAPVARDLTPLGRRWRLPSAPPVRRRSRLAAAPAAGVRVSSIRPCPRREDARGSADARTFGASARPFPLDRLLDQLLDRRQRLLVARGHEGEG